MTIAFHKSVGDTANTVGSTTINPAASALDVLIDAIISDSNALGTWNFAANGFVQKVSNQTTTDGESFGVGIKSSATGSEGSINTVQSGGGGLDNCIGAIASYSGVDNTTPEDIPTFVVNNNTAMAKPWTLASGSFTPLSAGAVIVAIFVSDVTNPTTSVANSFTTTAGSTGTWNVRGQYDNGFNHFCIADTTWISGSINFTATGTAAGQVAGRALAVIVLKPASAGATPKLFLPSSLNGLGAGGPFFHNRLG